MTRGEVWWVRFPREAVVTVAGRTGKAMADQLTTAAKSRLVRRLDRLEPGEMASVERAVSTQLGLRLADPAG